MLNKLITNYIIGFLNFKLESYNIYFIILVGILFFLIVILLFSLIISYYLIKYLEINVINDIYFCNYNYNIKRNLRK